MRGRWTVIDPVATQQGSAALRADNVHPMVRRAIRKSRTLAASLL